MMHPIAVYADIDRIRNKAHALVRKAVLAGELRALNGTINCVDCGAPAVCYDHRSYSKPLDVQPVCKSCNKRRGHAVDVLDLWAEYRRRKHCLGQAFQSRADS